MVLFYITEKFLVDLKQLNNKLTNIRYENSNLSTEIISYYLRCLSCFINSQIVYVRVYTCMYMKAGAIKIQ